MTGYPTSVAEQQYLSAIAQAKVVYEKARLKCLEDWKKAIAPAKEAYIPRP